MNASIEHLFVSPGHNFFGHYGKPAGTHPAHAVGELACVAGRGIRGDRFFDYQPDYAGQITFFEAEVFEALCAKLELAGATAAGLRRNVVTRGLDLGVLAGREFCLQGVWFRGAGECKPCYWMDAALAPGAEAWLRGRGGLRARILTDGTLRRGEIGISAAVPHHRLGQLSFPPVPTGTRE
jgi:MOSC domain-containing protein YiiM